MGTTQAQNHIGVLFFGLRGWGVRGEGGALTKNEPGIPPNKPERKNKANEKARKEEKGARCRGEGWGCVGGSGGGGGGVSQNE